MENKNNTNAVLSLVFGIISILTACTWYFSIINGTIAIIVGVFALKSPLRKRRELAYAGIVTGSVGILIGISVAIVYIFLYSSAGSDYLNALPGKEFPSQASPTPMPEVPKVPDALDDNTGGDIMFKLNYLRNIVGI
ncbi:MAG: hypothetical protein K6G63_07035 [Eubacterium sp.]|nr:hypothetical protein [Eubacterium sp.]